MNDAVVKIGGSAVEGLYAMAPFISLNAQKQTPELLAVIKRYRDKFNKEPDDGMVYGYIAVSLFADAARRAGRNLTVDTLVSSLEQVKDFKTSSRRRPSPSAPPSAWGFAGHR